MVNLRKLMLNNWDDEHVLKKFVYLQPWLPLRS